MLGNSVLCRNTHYAFRHARFCNTELISGALLAPEKKRKDSDGAHGQPVISSQETSCVLCVILFPKDFSSPLLNISLPFARSHCIGGVEASRTGLSVGKDSIMWPETLPDALSNAGFPSILECRCAARYFLELQKFSIHILVFIYYFLASMWNWSLLADHFIQGYVLVFLNGIEKQKSSAYLVCSLVFGVEGGI